MNIIIKVIVRRVAPNWDDPMLRDKSQKLRIRVNLTYCSLSQGRNKREQVKTLKRRRTRIRGLGKEEYKRRHPSAEKGGDSLSSCCLLGQFLLFFNDLAKVGGSRVPPSCIPDQLKHAQGILIAQVVPSRRLRRRRRRDANQFQKLVLLSPYSQQNRWIIKFLLFRYTRHNSPIGSLILFSSIFFY